MYTVLVFGIIETWEKTFSDYYDALKYSYKYRAKGFTTEIIEAYY